jgi:hypothetical protein
VGASPGQFTLASGQFAAQEGSSLPAVDLSTSPIDLTVEHFPDFLRSLFQIRDCGSMRKAGKQESSWCESGLLFGSNRFPHQPESVDESKSR